MISTINELKQALDLQDYVANDSLLTTVFLACALEKPLLVEGPAGVGKTQLAVTLARALERQLVRLQCYEGIDSAKALYDWNYPRQLLRIQAGNGEGWNKASEDIFGPEFLLERPLLKALVNPRPVLLLVDELDKSSEEFESFLLELLGEYQVTIPELGTIIANFKPLVVLTSNSSRDFSDALRRRCLHLFIDYPDFAREQEIVARHCAQVNKDLINESVGLVQKVRKLSLRKKPSIAESIDFVNALGKIGVSRISAECLQSVAGTLLKYPQDIKIVTEKAVALTAFDTP